MAPEVYKEPLDLLLLPHIGIQPRSIGILVMQLWHLTLHGKIADHPVIFRLYLVLFDDCIGQRGILHLCGQIQKLPDLSISALVLLSRSYARFRFQRLARPYPTA